MLVAVLRFWFAGAAIEARSIAALCALATPVDNVSVKRTVDTLRHEWRDTKTHNASIDTGSANERLAPVLRKK